MAKRRSSYEKRLKRSARRRARKARQGYTVVPGMPIAPVKDQYPHKRDEMFTPWTPQVLSWLEELRAEHGSWEAICTKARVSSRWFRMARSGKYKTISLSNLDKILTRCESNHRVEDLKWYSFDQLLEEGIWKPMPDLRIYPEWLDEAREFGQVQRPDQTGR